MANTKKGRSAFLAVCFPCCAIWAGYAEGQTNGDATLTADFAARDALPESTVPVSEWGTQKGWGPKAAVYPTVAVPPGHDPVTWKRARVVAVAKKYVGLPYRHHHVPGWEPSGATDPKDAGKGLVQVAPVAREANHLVNCCRLAQEAQWVIAVYHTSRGVII